MTKLKRLVAGAALAVAAALPLLTPSNAAAWGPGWHAGWGWHGGWGWGWRGGVYVGPRVVVGAPWVGYAPYYGYAPYRWVPAHYTPWGAFVPGHWGY